MSLRNTQSTWGSVAKVLHWIVAALVFFSIGYGWWMTHVEHFIKRNDVLRRMGWGVRG